MNQMLQDPEVKHSSEANVSPEAPDRPPPPPAHPRFAKPQRVAFVQSSWHREVVGECRIAFLDGIEPRTVARAQITLFGVPGSFECPLQGQRPARARRSTPIVAPGRRVRRGG